MRSFSWIDFLSSTTWPSRPIVNWGSEESQSGPSSSQDQAMSDLFPPKSGSFNYLFSQSKLWMESTLRSEGGVRVGE